MSSLPHWDLLVSHTEEDRRLVFLMLEALEHLVPSSYRVQLDGWKYRPGESMNMSLEEHLELVNHVILLITPLTLEGGWDVLVRAIEELQWQNPRPQNDGAPDLLLALATLAPEDLPSPLKRFESFDLRDGPSFGPETRRLAATLTRATPADSGSEGAPEETWSVHKRMDRGAAHVDTATTSLGLGADPYSRLRDVRRRSPTSGASPQRPENQRAEGPFTDTASGRDASLVSGAYATDTFTGDASSSSAPPAPVAPPPRATDEEENIATLQSEGLYHYRRGQRTQAHEFFARGLEASRKHFGSQHPRTGTALNNLAMVELELGNAEKARELLETSLPELEAGLGPLHKVVIDMRANLAAVLQELNLLREARVLQEEALSAAVQAWGIDHPQLASHFFRLGTIATRSQDYAMAWSAHARALALREASIGPDHLDTAESHDALGAVAFARGHLEEAREHLEQAFHICSRKLSPSDERTLAIRERLARVARAQGDLPTAFHLLSDLLEALEEKYGDQDVRLADVIDAVAAVNFLMGESEAAYRGIDRARQLKELALGPTHPAIAEALYHQARVARELNNLTAARRQLERAVEILESKGQKDSPDLAAVLNDLGLCCLEQGEPEEAQAPMERALRIWERTPATRSHCATALHNLAALAFSQGDRHRAIQLQSRARAIEAEFTHPS